MNETINTRIDSPESRETIELQKNSEYITEHRKTYRLVAGTIAVDIVPWDVAKNNCLAEAKAYNFYNAVEQGKMIPCLAVDDDFAHQSWRFRLRTTSQTAKIEILPFAPTNKLKNSFYNDARGNTNKAEGTFEKKIIEFYKKEKLKDDHVIIIQAAANDRAKENIESILIEGNGEGPRLKKGAPLYNAVQFVCGQERIPLIDYDKISTERKITVQDIAEASGFPCREIVLEENWYMHDYGSFIATRVEDGSPVGLVPSRSGYKIYSPVDNSVKKVTAEVAEEISIKAISISKPFPVKHMDWKCLRNFAFETFRWNEIITIALLALAGTLISALIPTLNQKIYDDFIPLGSYALLLQMCSLIGSFMIANIFLSITQNLYLFRISSRIGIVFQNATYDRLFNLPEAFFCRYDSADLAARASSAGTIVFQFCSITLSMILALAFSPVYLFRMFKYSSKLAWVAIAMVVTYAVLVYFLTNKAVKLEGVIEEKESKANSIFYQLICGIEKIRMAGAENHTIKKFLEPFMAARKIDWKKDRYGFLQETLAGIITTVFSMVFYYLLIKKKWNLTAGNFIGFNSAFGMLSSVVLSTIKSITQMNMLRPQYDRFKPIVREKPERGEETKRPSEGFDGSIELRDVTFTYDKASAPTIKNLTLRIDKGSYIGIVGPSGCGKSTFLKLLLGFEQPERGTIKYGSDDMQELDKQALRKEFGVVLQNGELIAGNIYENITITNPYATAEEVMDVVRQVGLEEDIKGMPMGLLTMLDEGAGTISGGQKQRILIARALISRPKILFLDEATSALDNVTQATVTETIRNLTGCTRIVIAHRLSTIRQCDNILVFNDGSIVQEGKHEMLMKQEGMYRELVQRQLSDSNQA